MKLVSFMGIHDTPWAVILPLCGWPFGIFLMKQFSENVPTELLEAAKIDGSGEIRTFTSIVMPIVKPGLGALAIFTFINTWNDYFMQLVMLNSRTNLTISLGVATLQQEFSTNYCCGVPDVPELLYSGYYHGSGQGVMGEGIAPPIPSFPCRSSMAPVSGHKKV